MRRLRVTATALATMFLVVAPALTPATFATSAGAQETTAAASDTPLTLAGDPFLTLSVDTVAPGTVTTSSEPYLTVKATVKNTGDRRVDDIAVRLQAADPISTRTGVRTSLLRDQQEYSNVGEFVDVPGSLEKGASAVVTLSLPLRSTTGPSLGVTEPGVYPVLVNVNGNPEYGGQARLDDARFLLPVVGVPRDPTVTDAQAPDAVPLPPNTTAPVGMTVLWPLADEPRLAAGIPGTLDEKVRLVDDDLATELAAGGRLDELLSAAEFATAANVDPDGRLAKSLCVTIDPDLLVTVSNMTRGYLVVNNPADPLGPATDGTGRAAANDWLTRLRTFAEGTCVLATPFAQADVNPVAAIGDDALVRTTVEAPADIVDTILGITSVRGVVWTPSGQLGAAAAEELRSLGNSTALLSSNAATSSSSPLSSIVGNPGSLDPAQTGTLDATVFDASTSTALAAVGSSPSTPSFTPEDQRYDLEQDSRTARLQNALGAISYQALSKEPARPGGVTVAPPQYWTAGDDEPSVVLSAVSSLMRSGLAIPRPLPDVIAGTPTGPAVETLDPMNAPDAAAQDRVRAQSARLDALQSTLVEDPQSALTPRAFTAPLREDLLRAMSTAGQGSAGQPAADAMAATRMSTTEAGLDAIYGAVTVLAPGGIYTLASEQSPLLLVARNDLPVGVNVLLDVDAPPEMIVSDVGTFQLPPRGSRTITVPTEVSDSRNLSVDFSLTTLGGARLGEPSTVSVRSNAYGQALAIITACAGALLLLLAGRRLWHRFRGQPDPADEGYERP